MLIMLSYYVWDIDECRYNKFNILICIVLITDGNIIHNLAYEELVRYVTQFDGVTSEKKNIHSSKKSV